MSDKNEESMIVRTLKIGLDCREIFYSKNGCLSQIEDIEKKLVFNTLREQSKLIGAMINHAMCGKYAELVLGTESSLLSRESKDAQGNSIVNKNGKVKKESIYKTVLQRLSIKRVLNSTVYDTMINNAVEYQFKGDPIKELLYKGERSLCTVKMDGTLPISFRDGACSIEKHGDRYFIVASVFSLEFKAEHNLKSTQIAFPLFVKRRDISTFRLMDRMISKEYDFRTAKIWPGDKGWLCSVSYKMPVNEKVNRNQNNILGIDMGITSPIVVSIFEDDRLLSWQKAIGKGSTIMKERQSIQMRIKRLNSELYSKDCHLTSETRINKIKKRDSLREQEKNYIKTASEKIVSCLAKISDEHKVGTWIIEDLDIPQLKTKDGEALEEPKQWISRNWAPGVLRDKIKMKAQELGIRIMLVDPRYTSQKCSSCGYTARENRPKGKGDWSIFKCIGCGHEDHADKNAAKNIVLLGLTTIKKECKVDDSLVLV